MSKKVATIARAKLYRCSSWNKSGDPF